MKKVLSLSVCLLLAVAAVSCSKGQAAAPPGGPGAGGPVPVKAGTVKVQAVPIQLSTFGTVATFSSIAIKTQVSGILTEVHFEKGQLLHKDQVIFKIDPQPFQAVLHQAEANKVKDEAGKVKDEAGKVRDEAGKVKDEVLLVNYKRTAQREADLYKRGTATKDEVDQAQTAADAQEAAIQGDQAAIQGDQAAIQGDQATIKGDQAAIEKAQIDLDNCTITCPIEGRAGDLLVTQGNFVKLNDITLVTINQIKPIEVFFNIPQKDMNAVRQYMVKDTLKVQVVLPGEPDRPEAGDLFFVDNTVDGGSGTIRLGAKFDNQDERLWPGQYVRVTLRLTTRNDAVVVSSKAVSEGRDGKYVFVIKPDKTVQSCPVTAGAQVGDLTVIEKGLKGGETVVTDGQSRLIDGAKVEIQSDKAPGTATTGASQPAAAPSDSPKSGTEAKP
jgi:multidrug efflux system membrane fusion protein